LAFTNQCDCAHWLLRGWGAGWDQYPARGGRGGSNPSLGVGGGGERGLWSDPRGPVCIKKVTWGAWETDPPPPTLNG